MTTDQYAVGHDGSDTREPYIHDDDSVMTVRQHANRTVEKHAWWFLPYLDPGMTLLDCGCASGSITVGLAKAVADGRVVGIDISDVEVGRARARAEKEKVSNVSFAVGNAYRLDFPDSSFDAVFGHNLLEHLSEPNRAIQEMSRVLKPGGVIGLRDFDIGGLLLAPRSEVLERFVSIYEADWKQLNGHPRLGRQLLGLVTQAGFADVTATASYEAFSGPEGRRFVAEVLIGGRLSDPSFVKRVIESGISTEEEIRAMRQAMSEWQDLPGAFLALAHAEVVGRKA